MAKKRLTAAAWLDPGQVPLIRAVAEAAGLDIRAAGTSQLGRAGEVAAALGGPGKPHKPLDDLRGALTSAEAEVFLLAAPGDFAAPNPGAGTEEADRAALADARDRGVRVFTLEPMPASLLQLDVPTLAEPAEALLTLGGFQVARDAATAAEWAAFCPPFRRSSGIREAGEVLPQLGLRTISVECLGSPTQGSLGARIYDAVEAVVSLLGVPERVHAAFISPGRTRGVHALPGDSLRGLDGDLTANLRFADGRAASVIASSRAGRWHRALTIIGESGRLRIDGDGFVWLGSDGAAMDSSRKSAGTAAPRSGRRVSPREDDPDATAIAAMADHISRTLDQAVPPERPTDVVGVLATAGAALLSARTGESESPATILRMAGTG